MPTHRWSECLKSIVQPILQKNMKLVTFTACLLCFVTQLVASEIFTIDEIGASVSFPNGWKHDTDDTFGFLIRPPDKDGKGKIRIHATEYKGISPEKAVERSVEKVNEIRKDQKLHSERLFGSTPITTQSGIKGQKAIIGPEGSDSKPYLNRYYFQKPDGSIFCICVYFFGNLSFAKQSEESIIESLRLTK
jgi:hypothetical protein